MRYTEEQIAARTAELGEQLSKDYAGKNPLVVGVLSGSFMFTADLCRQITPRHTIDFIKARAPLRPPTGLGAPRASSYEGTESTGKVELTLAPKCEIAGRHILLVEDIVDTGGTISTLRAHFEAAGAASVATATLLDKVARRTIDVPVEYVAFECEDAFVIGYGLDFDGVYRSLPYVQMRSTHRSAVVSHPSQAAVSFAAWRWLHPGASTGATQDA
eukprot:PRCOL_00003632-RA